MKTQSESEHYTIDSKRQNFYVAFEHNKEHHRLQVTGYAVKFNDFPGIEFFVRKGLNTWAGQVSMSKNNWDISEVKTGIKVTPHSYPANYTDKTRDGIAILALYSFEQRKIDLERMNQAINNWITKHGLAKDLPDYPQPKET